ncbi:hypothetical protein [Mucilaginibacter dorajii]|uniref:Lipoprotein n=1 Tax=Mucilaginibacter dorajii TaxID=692994 RepID=A0ABP7PW38_9SPHI|nr:hypothetical protein [Mucilaginibacter dorajii]MCS3734937.1 hypothetical protein [Mucilaginibacter dorajii]
MKKQLLLLGAIALFLGLTSCKKELAKTADVTKKDSKLSVNTLPAQTYNELTLIPRKAGENYDTYYTTFHGSNVYVTGNALYDQDKYPTLVNGQPCYAESMYSDNEGAIDFFNTGTDGNVFQISQGHWVYTDYTQMVTDFDNYFKAENTYIKNGATGVEPSIFTYVKDNYKSSSGSSLSPYLYVGKLIRVTTGSHWAVAELEYPLPSALPVATPSTFIDVADPVNSAIHYFLQGVKGAISQGNIATRNASGSWSTGAAVDVSGLYFQVTPGSGNYHSMGSIVRPDKTIFRFDQTANTN